MKRSALRPPPNFLRAAASRVAGARADGDSAAHGLLAFAAMDEAEALASAGSSLEGLDAAEAAARLAAIGPNLVAHEGPPGMLRELWARMKNPLNALLWALAMISYAVGDVHAAVVIMAIVAIAVAMAFIQEHRSNAAAAKLRALVKMRASVKRRDANLAQGQGSAGDFAEIASELLVPGDIIRLSAGDMVPADLRLLSTKDLYLDQSTMTGEAMPCEKTAQPCENPLATALEAPNLALMGASVTSGFATGLALRTGAKTYFGQLAQQIASHREPTSFDEGVNKFIWLMIRFMLVLAPAVFLINGVTTGDWLGALLYGLAVAVGLTPEMLPMVVTVNLAKGAISMSRKRVIVKRLSAIQNFGAMDVLCTDKTGTLTQSRIDLSLHLDVNGDKSQKALDYAFLNSFHQSGLRSLLDKAIFNFVLANGRSHVAEGYACIDEIPFDFCRRRLSVILRSTDPAAKEGAIAGALRRFTGVAANGGKAQLLVCKGAVEEVLAACTCLELDGKILSLDERRRAQARDRAQSLNEDGLRVIAVAYKEIARARDAYSVSDEDGLTLVGFIAFLDPPKDRVGETLAALKKYGVTVKVLTGDNEAVTSKICREVGLAIDGVLLGSQIESLTDAELAERAEKASIFAKVSPEQKARVIAALHAKGHVVGFLGDGINDSLALKAADVGVSVDTAVDIAKESADIILLEKSLLVLEQGLLEGRRVFGNIIKYIKMGASSNFGSMFSVLGASALLPFLPMLPIQVLTNNLLYDFSQTAIPTDHVDDEYVAAPRKWDIDNIFRFMVFIGPISSIFDYTTFFVMLSVFDGFTHPALFQTGWFVESLLTQTLIIHVIRTARTPFVESWPSTTLFLTSVAICAIGGALPYTSLGALLKFTPLPPLYWMILVASLLAYGTLTEAVKAWFISRYGV